SQVSASVAEELDEFADDPLLAQYLRDREHEVGRSGTRLQASVQAEADDLRNQHRDRLAEHGGLRLDAADAPAEYAEAVDHRGVRVSADQRVRICAPGSVGLGVEDDPAEVLQVDLVDDARARRDDRAAAARRLPPAQERVPLA